MAGNKNRFRITVKKGIKAGLILLALGLLVYAFIPEAEQVDLVAVEKGDVLITLDAEGKTRIRDIYVVSAPIDGRVMRLESEPGDRVIAGQTVIAHMTSADPRFLDRRSEIQARADLAGAEAAMALATAGLRRTQAELDFAVAEYGRAEALFEKGNIASARLEQADLLVKMRKAAVETARADVKVMESRRDVAKAQLLQPGTGEDGLDSATCQLCVHAPVDGEILRIRHESEGVISMGTPLVDIGNADDMEIVLEMLSRDAVKVRPGQKATIKRWGGDQDIPAQVRLIEPSGYTKISALGVEEQRVNVILDFTGPEQDRQSLGDAFRVEAVIIIDKIAAVHYIPISALFRDGDQWACFVERNGRAVLQPVTVGRRNDWQAVILDGLSLNDQVITHPGNAIMNGTRITTRNGG